MRDVAIVSFASAPNRRADLRNEVEILMPIVQEAVEQSGLARAHRLHLLRVERLPPGPAVRVRDGARRGRRVAADRRVARRDGRRVGALRGVGEDPDRRGRHGAGLRVRQVVAGRSARSARDRSSIRTAGAALARRGVARRATGARAISRASGKTERDLAEIAVRSRRDAKNNPNAQLRRLRSSRSCSASRIAVAAPQARLPADLRRRRRRWCWRGRSRTAGCTATGVDPRHRPSHRAARPRRARSHAFAVDTLAGEKAGVGKAPVDVAELHAPFTHQELILREALGLGARRHDQPVGWRAHRQPDDGRRTHPHRRSRRAASAAGDGEPRRRARDLGSVPATKPRLRSGG